MQTGYGASAVTIRVGDAAALLRALPAESVHWIPALLGNGRIRL
jgi:hypothetical protein